MPDLQGIKKAKGKGKKKNPGPQDFKKQKVKVGRKLVKKNETSTTIKSRKLNLQKQSVAVDRTGKEVNSRGLTLAEILSHSTHYNANMRKECLAGIRDFFELHPELLSLHVGAVLEKVSDMITDEDAVVRKEFRALSKQLLRDAEPAAMAPHLRMFLAHVCGGMSHVHESVRASALALLDDIVPLFPYAAALCGHKMLPIFLHILGGGENIGSMTGGATSATGAAAWATMSVGSSRGPKLKTMALDERLSILRNLHALLKAIVGLCFAHTHAAAVAARGAGSAEQGGRSGAPAGPGRVGGRAGGGGGGGHSRNPGFRTKPGENSLANRGRQQYEWQDGKPTNLLPGHGARAGGFMDGGRGGGGGRCWVAGRAGAVLAWGGKGRRWRRCWHNSCSTHSPSWSRRGLKLISVPPTPGFSVALQVRTVSRCIRWASWSRSWS